MNAMRPCHLQISTRADGEEESLFSAEAEMELAPQSALLRYRQGEGVVLLRIREGEVSLEREGDYRLRLSFSEGRALPGILGIASAEGRVETFTRRVGCSIGKNSVLLALRYTLRLEGGDREMRIRLSARNKGEPEEK